MFVDVHTHLTHEDFATDRGEVVARAKQAGLSAIVVNGLDPVSNRMVLQLAAQESVIRPALGIYPLEAANDCLDRELPFPVSKFDVDAEVAFIAEQVRQHKIVAVGECGLDGYWVGEGTFSRQEEVFRRLLVIARDADIPAIIHTRKREERAVEILLELGMRKVNFHCFGGKVKLALKCAREYGWWFSIPANARVNEAFTKMLRELPEHKILTETDAPYLPPRKGERNEPANVVGTVQWLAELRGWTPEQAQQRVLRNFQDLFGA